MKGQLPSTPSASPRPLAAPPLCFFQLCFHCSFTPEWLKWSVPKSCAGCRRTAAPSPPSSALLAPPSSLSAFPFSAPLHHELPSAVSNSLPARRLSRTSTHADRRPLSRCPDRPHVPGFLEFEQTLVAAIFCFGALGLRWVLLAGADGRGCFAALGIPQATQRVYEGSTLEVLVLPSL